MRIAIFTNNYLPRVSGVAVAVNSQQTGLRKLGHKTIIIAPDYALKGEQAKSRVMRVKSLAFTSQRFAIPLAFLDRASIEEELESFDPDLIHTHHPFLLGKTALDLADQMQVPLIYTFHTLYDNLTHYFLMDTKQVRKEVRRYVVNFANCCDLVITPTDPIRHYMANSGVNTRTATLPTGIDFSRFDHISNTRLKKRKQTLHLARFEKVIFYAGRISLEKNLGLVINALKKLVDQGRNVCLLIAGEGPAQRSLQREAEDLGVEDHIIWAGFISQPELPELYYLADLFVFASPADTQGIVLYEARAAGLPIVAVDSMASQAIVKDGENGLIARNEPRDFARKIAEILDNPEDFSAPFDRNQFSNEYLVKRLAGLYEQAISHGRVRQGRALGTIFFPFFNP